MANKQGHGGIEQRIWMHWKSLKMTWRSDSGVDYDSYDRALANNSYHVTPNWVWLRLARVHKMPVRAIKDIISARRNYTPKDPR